MDPFATPSSGLWFKMGSNVARFSVWPLTLWSMFSLSLFLRGCAGHFHHSLGSKSLLMLAFLLAVTSVLVRKMAEQGDTLATLRTSFSRNWKKKNDVGQIFLAFIVQFLPSLALIFCGVAL